MSIGPHPPGGSTPPIRYIWREVSDRWGNRVTSWGVFVCRNISGTSTPSQHAWGNAWDIHASTGLLDVIARFLRSERMEPWVYQVLWRVADHYDHIHVDGRPYQHGVPPCMGNGGGQRDGHARRRVPLPEVGELISAESWVPAAWAAARHLARSAERASSWAATIGDVMRRR